MAHWLMKTEPHDYSWDRLVAEGETSWTGVRNPQAAANMRAMALGDEVFFYRSVVEPAIVGVMAVSTLKAIKADPRFADLALVRQSRLSVLPVSDAHWVILIGMAGLAP